MVEFTRKRGYTDVNKEDDISFWPAAASEKWKNRDIG
jgi:hypothetical protein